MRNRSDRHPSCCSYVLYRDSLGDPINLPQSPSPGELVSATPSYAVLDAVVLPVRRASASSEPASASVMSSNCFEIAVSGGDTASDVGSMRTSTPRSRINWNASPTAVGRLASSSASSSTAASKPTPSVPEDRRLRRLPVWLGDAAVDNYPAQWHIAARFVLGKSNHVGRDIPALGPKPSSKATEAADDAVDDEQDSVAPAHCRDPFNVAFGWRVYSTRTDHRLNEEGGDTVGAELLNRGLECLNGVVRND